jgi:UDPglucose 6-dehydrogenase
MYPNISIVGAGFLGSAIYHGFSPYCQIKFYDKYKEGYSSAEEVANFSKFIFICVPTPLDSEDKQDISSMDDAVKTVAELATERKIIIPKSTILPGTTRRYVEMYPQHDFVFNPEFLTERNHILDFLNQSRIVLGGKTNDDAALNEVEALYRIKFEHTPIFKCTYEEGEFLKYMCNGYFALKIIYMNEVYRLCEKKGYDFEKIKNMFLSDQRIGNSHCQVPGFDGMFGYGGKCFPKDIRSIVSWAKENEVDLNLLDVTDQINTLIRPLEDWRQIKGATTENNYGIDR